MRHNRMPDELRPTEELIASFGGATIIRTLDRKFHSNLRIVGGTQKDRATAQAWTAAYLARYAPHSEYLMRVTPKRQFVDPGFLFPAMALRTCEENALRLLNLYTEAILTGRSRDCLQIALPSGAEDEVEHEAHLVILVTDEAFDIRLPTIHWMGPHEPVDSSVRFRCRPAKTIAIALKADIEQARECRRRQFLKCRYCGLYFPPERRDQPHCCHGCSEKYLGVCH